MANATAEKPPVNKASAGGWDFGVEIDTKNNGDVLLQSIPGVRLRGAIDASKPIIADPKQNTGEFEPTIPADRAAGLGALPKVPGMRIFVNIQKKTYRIEDPLYNNESLCNRIARAMNDKGQTTGKLNGTPPKEGKESADRIKNLCRELRQLVDDGDAREVVDGTLPKLEEIDILDGNYLLNPGARTPSMQPQYEKDFDGWVQRLAQGGG